MAEGEFALVKNYLEAAGKKPLSTQGFLVNETERYSLLADLAVLERDEAALRHYAPLVEEMAVRDGPCFKPAPIAPGGYCTGWRANTRKPKPG
jgi:hypothetical protein